MKKLTVLIMFLFSLSIKAQWNWLNPSGNGGELTTSYVSGSNVWITGKNGRIIHSWDKGNNWENIKSNTTSTINSIEFIDSENGFFTTDAQLFKTQNGGKIWSNLNVKFDFISTGFSFKAIDKKSWLAFNTWALHITSDYGATWKQIYSLPISGIRQVFPIDSNNIFLVYAEQYFYPSPQRYTVIKTSDGGNTWNNLFTAIGFPSFKFLNKDIFWFIFPEQYIWASPPQKPMIKFSNNGGQSFETFEHSKNINWISFSDDKNGIALMNDSVYTTSSSGKNWRSIDAFAIPVTNNNIFIDEFSMVNYSKNGSILKTDSRGKNWASIIEYFSDEIISLKMESQFSGILVSSNGTVFQTNNSGNSWSIKYKSTEDYIYTNGFITSSNIIYLIGYNYQGADATLLSSNDGGKTWAKTLLKNCYAPNCITFYDSQNGFIAGSNNNIFRTSDGGKNWNEISLAKFTSNIERVVTIYCYSSQSIYLSLSSGKILKSIDNLQSLEEFVTDYNIGTTSIFFLNNNLGFFGGTQGRLKITRDGGKTWSSVIQLNVSNEFLHIAFLDSLNGAALVKGENNPRVVETKDGGLTWQVIELGESGVLKHLYYQKPSRMWLFGKNGNLLNKSWNSTDSITQSNLPVYFSLSQNYPNPFNPETIIEYSIPKSEHVTLKVYDVLGREVATLVNENKSAGTYKVTFNVKTRHGASLQSGVYFYRLTSGSYSETKKLILMK